VGLTPPKYTQRFDERFRNVQEELWGCFTQEIEKIKPIDVLIFNGDAVDGPGERSGGTEQITTDRNVQVEMAVECVEQIGAEQNIMTFGTAYHAGDKEDWEQIVADKVGAKIGAHDWPEVNGLVFDIKHHIGSSEVPHTRGTPIGREMSWNAEWAIRKQQPLGQVLIRSHVHYYSVVVNGDRIGMTTPALCGFGTKYGSRRKSGTIDMGFVYFDVAEGGSYTWKPVLFKPGFAVAHTTSL
jgi:hypothetical protein